MRAYIKAELLKNRHSEWARLMVIFPTISILCSVYFSFGNAAYYQMNQYNWWYMCFLPIQVIAGRFLSAEGETSEVQSSADASCISREDLDSKGCHAALGRSL